MHELSLCESLLDIIKANAKTQGYTRVKQVWLEVGALAAVEPEAMHFGFDAVTRGSLAEGARLHIIELPAKAWCIQCSRLVEVKQRFAPCPQCQSPLFETQGGDELRIRELEVE
jgi:hydrogenase nickel incorporation protein HypA/HybF